MTSEQIATAIERVRQLSRGMRDAWVFDTPLVTRPNTPENEAISRAYQIGYWEGVESGFRQAAGEEIPLEPPSL